MMKCTFSVDGALYNLLHSNIPSNFLEVSGSKGLKVTYSRLREKVKKRVQSGHYKDNNFLFVCNLQ